MALPKKGIRKITVDGLVYGWSATGNDGWIGLTIAPLFCEGQLLTAQLGYHAQKTGETTHANGVRMSHWQQQMMITPKTVRRVIEYGLQMGWTPEVKQKQLDLGVLDELIN